MPFTHTRRVEFHETDMAGIAHFANFFRYMEAAEHAYLRACGLSVVLPWEGQLLGFPRVSASCDYLKPIRFEQEMLIHVRVEKIGRTSISYGFTFTHSDEKIAEGRLTAVLCRKTADERLEPLEIPAALRERLLAGPNPATPYHPAY
ncbi:MAG: thioesterase family protein [Gemmataceae bacterium]